MSADEKSSHDNGRTVRPTLAEGEVGHARSHFSLLNRPFSEILGGLHPHTTFCRLSK